jgi:hypothetical protein
MFVTAGILAFAYFEIELRRGGWLAARSVPSQAEDERWLCYVWLGLGVLLLLRAFTQGSLADSSSGYLTAFLIGFIVGIVWLRTLKWFIGLKWAISTLPVMPFPFWVWAALRRLVCIVRGK